MKRAWLVAVIAVLAVAPSRAEAATLYFTNTVGAAWGSATNWWLDAECTQPSSAIPADGDSAFMLWNLDTKPDVPVQPSSVTWIHGANQAELVDFECVITFTKDSFNDNGGTVRKAVFVEISYNTGAVYDAVFNAISYNANSVQVGTFNGSSYQDEMGSINLLRIASSCIAGEWVANGSLNAATIGGVVLRAIVTGAAFPATPTARGGSNAIVP